MKSRSTVDVFTWNLFGILFHLSGPPVSEASQTQPDRQRLLGPRHWWPRVLDSYCHVVQRWMKCIELSGYHPPKVWLDLLGVHSSPHRRYHSELWGLLTWWLWISWHVKMKHWRVATNWTSLSVRKSEALRPGLQSFDKRSYVAISI